MDETPQEITDEEAQTLIATLLATSQGAIYALARRQVEAAPSVVRVAAAAEALRRSRHEPHAYIRAAHLLVDWEIPTGTDSLFAEAAQGHPCSVYAIRALHRCRDSRVASMLLELLSCPQDEVRIAAAIALARSERNEAIVPLLAFAEGADTASREVLLDILARFGAPEKLARRLLAMPALSPHNLRYALQRLPNLYPHFVLERFLTRETLRRNSPIQERAKAMIDVILAESLLLRPAQQTDSDRLLHILNHATAADPMRLLHPADAPPGRRKRSLWRRLLRVFDRP